MTPAEARAFQDQARAAGRWLMWFVSTADPNRLGKAVAWAIVADPRGGKRLPGLLCADTVDALRGLLPAGLTRREPTAVMPAMVLETWD